MSVVIGHASIDENGKARSGAAGDQTGKEVCTRSWYNKNWLCVIRPKKADVAEMIAAAMEAACANANIGYDQDQRTTCYDRAKEVGFDLSKIATPCETDCSALVAVCVNAAGVKVSQHIWTGNEEAALIGTGEFESLRASKYLTKADHLKRGDILLSSGHTAVVLSNDNPAEEKSAASESAAAQQKIKLDPAAFYDAEIAGTYMVTASALNVRAGAGTDKQIMRTIPNGAKVRNYGYFSVSASGRKWLYIAGKIGGKQVEGFCSEASLKKS